MTEHAITTQSVPEISEEERRSRLWRAYQIILECAGRSENEAPDSQEIHEYQTMSEEVAS
jgi:hypothetical protein